VGLERKIALSVLIETAMGMIKCEEIATASPERMEAMVFGVADYAASLQSHTTSVGGTNPEFAMLADREEVLFLGQGASAISGISGAMRCRGSRGAIHPSQVRLANDVFTPSADIAHRTRRIIAAMEHAAAEGKGAGSLDGCLIDAASIRTAQNLPAKLDQLEARQERAPELEPRRGRIRAAAWPARASTRPNQCGRDCDAIALAIARHEFHHLDCNDRHRTKDADVNPNSDG
jgi:citrate lyase beta subunit